PLDVPACRPYQIIALPPVRPHPANLLRRPKRISQGCIDPTLRRSVVSPPVFEGRQRNPVSQEPTRREFLGTLAAFSLFPLEQEKPDLILHNGNILAVNDRGPHAQAVAIVRDRFLAVGSDSEVMNLASAATKKIDLGGKKIGRASC